MSIRIFSSVETLLNAYAEFFINTAQQSQEYHGEFNVVLSGGKSPEKLYELLASEAYHEKLNWKKINFFFGDERYVPVNDPQSNERMIKAALFNTMKIPSNQIFSIDTNLPPVEAAEEYTTHIENHFKNRPVQFDLIMLGLGDNGHTASLFPHTPVLSETRSCMKAVFLKEQNFYRLTMTAPLINQARSIAFLVYGTSKAKAVYEVIKGKKDVENYPAQLILPENGTMEFFLDKTAAGSL